MATTTTKKKTTTARSTATRYIGIDVHCQFCEGGVIDSFGRECGHFHVATSIPTLLEAIEKVRRPRTVVIEEGPLADWLQRHLTPHVDEMIVCDPYRNALIAKEGDKSDPIDWRKLADLCRGGYVKAVHQRRSLARSMLKQHVQVLPRPRPPPRQRGEQDPLACASPGRVRHRGGSEE